MSDEGKMLVEKAPENLSEARELLADLTKKYLNGEIREVVLRACTYSLNALVKALHAEKAGEVDRRLTALEKLRAAK